MVAKNCMVIAILGWFGDDVDIKYIEIDSDDDEERTCVSRTWRVVLIPCQHHIHCQQVLLILRGNTTRDWQDCSRVEFDFSNTILI